MEDYVEDELFLLCVLYGKSGKVRKIMPVEHVFSVM